MRRRVLRRQPLCADCLARGRTEAAAEVDHVLPLRLGGAAWSADNLQSLCVECHRAKTARENSVRQGSRRRGCDIEGRPLPLEVSGG